jgi:hypothetical protein
VTATRIVPAVVRGEQIFIQCASWCTVDHVANPEGYLVDIWHMGDHANLNVPRMGQSPELMAFASIELDRHSSDPMRQVPFISVEDSSADGFDMTPDLADQFAANLEAFAEQIRMMARTARGEA